MICETCHGTGKRRLPLRNPVVVGEESQGPGLPPVVVEATAVLLPCPACGGSGFTHCCDGERPT